MGNLKVIEAKSSTAPLETNIHLTSSLVKDNVVRHKHTSAVGEGEGWRSFYSLCKLCFCVHADVMKLVFDAEFFFSHQREREQKK